MSSNRKDIIELVDGVCKGLNVKRFLMIVLAGVSLTGLILLATGTFISNFLPREDQQFKLFLALMVIPLLFTVYAVRQLFKARTTRRDIALKVEEEMPELMDSYACALEIAERGGPRGPIEAALSSKLEGKFQSGEITKMVTPKYLASPFIMILFLLTFGLVWASVGSNLSKTAATHIGAKSDSALAGITVTPGDVRVASGSDLRVEAVIKRGELKAELQYILDGEWQKITMVEEDRSTFSGVIYGVLENTSYRVVSPNVSSSEYSIEVFLKPEIKSFSAQVEPPSYTKKKSFKVTEIKDLAVPEDSVIKLSFKTNKDTRAYLVKGKAEISAGSEFKSSHTVEMMAEKDASYSLKIVDGEGNEALSKPFKINVVKDMPPHIEITKPGKDVKKKKYDLMQLEISALDDYGLTDVELVMDDSYGLNQKFKLFSKSGKERTLEKNIFYDLELKDFGLKPGDIITYYVSATDNKQPVPQTSRTKVYFIEIRPDKSDLQDKEEQEPQDGQPQEELSIKDLVNSSKDLVRKIIDTKTKSRESEKDKGLYEISAEKQQELSSEAAKLRLDIKKRFEELEKKAAEQNMDMGVFGELFESAMKNLETAEENLDKKKLQAGLTDASKSLSDLVKIEIELEKNSVKQKSKSKQPQPPKDQQEQEEKKEERLADMLEKLEELEEQQEQLNQDLEKMDKEELAEKEAMQEKMEEQQKRMEELQDELQDQQQQQASQQMQQASQQQQQAQQQMQQGNSQGAQQSSRKAEEEIKNAKNEIKRAMREQAREKLQQLADKLDKAVEKQKQLGEQTDGVGDPRSEEGKKEMAGLKDKQEEVQGEMQKIMDQLGAAANELDEKYPEVAEAIRDAREFGGSQGIDRRLKRASNALHYRRKDAARREQQKAEEAMNMLGHKVRDAVGRLPQATLEELLKMRQQVEMARREMSGMQSIGASEAGELSKELQKMMVDIGEKTKNMQLQNDLPQFLDQLGNKGDAAAMVEGQIRAVNQAAMILDRMISELDLEKRLSLNKRTGSAPDKYRKSVREYLKSLSSQDK